MQIVRPVTVTDAVMTYTNVPEDDAPAWAAGDYVEGEIVIRDHAIYEALIDTSDDPRDGATASPPTWLRLGASRPWRMYDQRVRNVTRALEPYDATKYNAYDDADEANGIAFTLEPGMLVDSLTLLNINGLFAHVKVETINGIVYESRTPLSGGLSESSWHSYFYTPIDRRTQLVLTDLPKALDAKVHIAVEELSSPAQIGELILGRAIEIGQTQYGASVSIIDYSKKERDDFGNLIVTQRRYTQLAEYPIQMPRQSADVVYQLLAGLRTEPTLFIGTTEHSSLVVYGIYRDMRITFDNYATCVATLEVEEI